MTEDPTEDPGETLLAEALHEAKVGCKRWPPHGHEDAAKRMGATYAGVPLLEDAKLGRLIKALGPGMSVAVHDIGGQRYYEVLRRRRDDSIAEGHDLLSTLRCAIEESS